jgi:hypothetical protein
MAEGIEVVHTLTFAPRSCIGNTDQPGPLFPVWLAGFNGVMSHPYPAAEMIHAYRTGDA